MEHINDTPQHQTEFMISLYRQYADDLRQVREQQRTFYQTLSCPLFDDIEGEWLYLLIRYLGEPSAVHALEVGSGSGLSSSWILRALSANRFGHLTSVDIQATTDKNLIPEIIQNRWTFLQCDVMKCLDALPSTVDFLLVDSDHDSPKVEHILEKMFPRVCSGGFACVHDIYMLPTPRQGEAVAVFQYLERIGVRPFTPSHCFPEAFDTIQAVRQELHLGDPIHPSPVNPLLIFQVP